MVAAVVVVAVAVVVVVVAVFDHATPAFVGEHRVKLGKGKKKATGFQLTFSNPLRDAEAKAVSHYQVTQGKKKIGVKLATLSADGKTVTLTLGKLKAAKGLQLTATGLSGADGSTVATVNTGL